MTTKGHSLHAKIIIPIGETLGTHRFVTDFEAWKRDEFIKYLLLLNPT